MAKLQRNEELVTTMQADAVRFAVEILERTRDGIVLPYPGSLEHAINGLRHYCLGEVIEP